MSSEPAKFLAKVRYFGSVGAVYALTLLFVWGIFRPAAAQPAPAPRPVVAPLPILSDIQVTSGRPVRLLVPSLNIDLPVDIGLYNSADQSWTLSGYHAQWAELSPIANDHDGNTFIYGHRNKYVFLYLYKIQPGQDALVYTDNGHVFQYKYVATNTVQPNDTSVLSYSGPPIMTIQTCGGSWNEVRQMFTFDFVKVVQ